MLKKYLLKVYDKWISKEIQLFIDLLDVNARRILDLGCGDGSLTRTIKEKTRASIIVGVDIYEPLLRLAKSRDIEVIRYDLNRFPYPFKDNYFDIIISHQVIEHLFYPIKFLKEIYRLLKSGGYAIIATENLSSWDNILALMLGYSPFSMQFDNGLKIGNPLSIKSNESLNYPPHVRIFSWYALIDAAKSVGFKIERIEGVGHILGLIGEKVDKKHCRFIVIKLLK